MLRLVSLIHTKLNLHHPSKWAASTTVEADEIDRRVCNEMRVTSLGEIYWDGMKGSGTMINPRCFVFLNEKPSDGPVSDRFFGYFPPFVVVVPIVDSSLSDFVSVSSLAG